RDPRPDHGRRHRRAARRRPRTATPPPHVAGVHRPPAAGGRRVARRMGEDVRRVRGDTARRLPRRSSSCAVGSRRRAGGAGVPRAARARARLLPQVRRHASRGARLGDRRCAHPGVSRLGSGAGVPRDRHRLARHEPARLALLAAAGLQNDLPAAVSAHSVTRVPMLAGSRLVVITADDDALVLRPPPPGDAVADVGAAVRDALRFHGHVEVHDVERDDLVDVGTVGAVRLRVHPALVHTDLVVVVTAAETVLHGGPAALVGAAGPETLRAAGAYSLLETSASQGWRLGLELERALARRVPLIGASLVLNHPRLGGTLGGYPY